jgi:hypothetical protein
MTRDEFPPGAGAPDDVRARARDDLDAAVRARYGSRIAGVLEREPAWARAFDDLAY